MAQVYVHNARIPHAHFSEMATRGGYYESGGMQLEPPPAHRAAASISVVVPPPPSVASGSPYISGGASVSVSVQPAPHSLHPSQAKLLEREREQRERERENERLSMVAAVGKYSMTKQLIYTQDSLRLSMLPYSQTTAGTSVRLCYARRHGAACAATTSRYGTTAG